MLDRKAFAQPAQPWQYMVVGALAVLCLCLLVVLVHGSGHRSVVPRTSIAAVVTATPVVPLPTATAPGLPARFDGRPTPLEIGAD